MAKPEQLTISQVVERCSVTRPALFKKCSRAHAKKQSIVFINGSGWYSITKPGRDYILYLVQPDTSGIDFTKQLDNAFSQLFDIINSLVCEECQEPVEQLKNKNIAIKLLQSIKKNA